MKPYIGTYTHCQTSSQTHPLRDLHAEDCQDYESSKEAVFAPERWYVLAKHRYADDLVVHKLLMCMAAVPSWGKGQRGMDYAQRSNQSGLVSDRSSSRTDLKNLLVLLGFFPT